MPDDSWNMALNLSHSKKYHALCENEIQYHKLLSRHSKHTTSTDCSFL